MLSGAIDVLQVLALLGPAELCRRYAGPKRCAVLARALGRRRASRTPEARLRFRRFIRAIDVRLPDGGDCYRRALVEMGLHPPAATEPLPLWLVPDGGPKSGHAPVGQGAAASQAHHGEVP